MPPQKQRAGEHEINNKYITQTIIFLVGPKDSEIFFWIFARGEEDGFWGVWLHLSDFLREKSSPTKGISPETNFFALREDLSFFWLQCNFLSHPLIPKIRGCAFLKKGMGFFKSQLWFSCLIDVYFLRNLISTLQCLCIPFHALKHRGSCFAPWQGSAGPPWPLPFSAYRTVFAERPLALLACMMWPLVHCERTPFLVRRVALHL